jgi:hypothetical protein
VKRLDVGAADVESENGSRHGCNIICGFTWSAAFR